eukprot:1243834-Amphidinium_carterae.1
MGLRSQNFFWKKRRRIQRDEQHDTRAQQAAICAGHCADQNACGSCHVTDALVRATQLQRISSAQLLQLRFPEETRGVS